MFYKQKKPINRWRALQLKIRRAFVSPLTWKFLTALLQFFVAVFKYLEKLVR